MKLQKLVIRIGSAGLGLLLLSVMVTPLYAQQFNRLMRRHTYGMLSNRFLGALELEIEQEEMIDTIKDAYRDTLRSFRVRSRNLREQMVEKLLQSDVLAEADLSSVHSQLSALWDEYLQAGITKAQEVRNVLTPEQRTKAREIRENLRQLRGQMRGLLDGN